MTFWETVKQFGSEFCPRTIHPQGLATAGALLTCLAVALNIGPFAKPAKKDVSAQRSKPGAWTAAVHDNEVGIAFEHLSSVVRPRQAGVGTPEYDALAAIAQAVHGEPRSLANTATAKPAAKPWGRAEAVTAPAPAATATGGNAGSVKDMPAADATASVQLASHRQTDDANADLARNDAFVGVWAPNAGTCSARNFREGDLPAIISAEGAWAGETFCLFSSKKQTQAGWSVVAKCTSPKERWTVKVNLSVKDNRLTWKSKRGTQAYTRCSSDVLMTAAR